MTYAFTGDRKFGGFSSQSLNNNAFGSRLMSFAPMYYNGPAMKAYWQGKSSGTISDKDMTTVVDNNNIVSKEETQSSTNAVGYIVLVFVIFLLIIGAIVIYVYRERFTVCKRKNNAVISSDP